MTVLDLALTAGIALLCVWLVLNAVLSIRATRRANRAVDRLMRAHKETTND
jgi:hypothetical protein